MDDSLVDRAIEAIQTAAHTGRIGDGKIFVTPGRGSRSHPYRRERQRRRLTRTAIVVGLARTLVRTAVSPSLFRRGGW